MKQLPNCRVTVRLLWPMLPNRSSRCHDTGANMQTMRVSLITGGARRRVGGHVADALGRRGYAIVIHYNRSATDAQLAVEEFGGRGIQAIGLAADLANEEHVKNLVAKTRERFGRIDVLV